MNPLDQFDTVIRQGKHGVIAMVPPLHLYAGGNDVLLAIDALEQKRKALAADLSKAGILEEVIDRAHGKPGRSGRAPAPSVAASLALFAAKAAIVVVLVAAVTGLGLGSAARVIRHELTLVSEYMANLKVGGHQFWGRVREELHRQAKTTSDPPAAERQQILSDIRVIVVRWRPFVHEAMLVFAPPDQPTQHPPGSDGAAQP